MSKAFEAVMAGLGEALEHARGERELQVHVPMRIDVKAIRVKSALSQPKFAHAIGVKVGTLRNWEQKRREPEGPARVLLAMIDRKPSIVEDTLGVPLPKRKRAAA
jgi:putative transcriptional regulator